MMQANGLSQQAGFNLLELMIIVAILGILAAVSLPSMMSTIGRISANSSAKTVLNSLSLARSEAIKRGQTITFCATSNGTDCEQGAWNSGWMIFIDNNTDADGDTGSVDVGDEVIQVFDPLADTNVTFTADLFQYGGRGMGLAASAETLKICPVDNDPRYARAVILGISGRARVVGYDDDGDGVDGDSNDEDDLACP